MNIIGFFIIFIMFLAIADAMIVRIRQSGHGGKVLLLILAAIAAVMGYANSVIP